MPCGCSSGSNRQSSQGPATGFQDAIDQRQDISVLLIKIYACPPSGHGRLLGIAPLYQDLPRARLGVKYARRVLQGRRVSCASRDRAAGAPLQAAGLGRAARASRLSGAQYQLFQCNEIPEQSIRVGGRARLFREGCRVCRRTAVLDYMNGYKRETRTFCPATRRQQTARRRPEYWPTLSPARAGSAALCRCQRVSPWNTGKPAARKRSR